MRAWPRSASQVLRLRVPPNCSGRAERIQATHSLRTDVSNSTRCSNAVAYYEELCLFYKRLRARGYPTAFLKKQFDRHPAYSCRKHLLYRESQSPTAISGPSVLALPYADGVDSALRGLLRDHGNLLPPHIACQRRLFAWCKAPKIKDLIPVPGKNSLDANFLLDSTAAALDVPSMTHPNAAAHFFL
jgi:hypothetical protein